MSVVYIMIFGIQLYLTLYGINSSIVLHHAFLFHSLKSATNHSLVMFIGTLLLNHVCFCMVLGPVSGFGFHDLVFLVGFFLVSGSIFCLMC